MSRIGKAPITVPQGVELTLAGRDLTVKGAKGTLNWMLPANILAELSEAEGKQVMSFKPENDNRRHAAMWGTTRAIVANMVVGVKDGYSVPLKLVGVGYRANMQGNTLVLNVGYSHAVNMPCPEGIKAEVTDNVNVVISGVDKQKVGEFAANIRKQRKPEPFKGKGIRYADEHINMKEGKKK